MAFKFFSILAVLAVGAQAGWERVPHRDTAVCSRTDPQEGEVCNGEGYITNDPQGWLFAVTKPSVQACAESCASTYGCDFFVWRDGGYCEVYFTGTLSDAGFFEASSQSFWYEMGCWTCEPVGLFLDFENEDVSGWTLTTAAEDVFFLDIQTPYTPDGGTSHALRIGEIANEGSVLAEYGPDMVLEAGHSYKMKFFAKSTASSTNWDLVTITIASSPTIYKSHPVNPTDIGGGWFSFEDNLVLDASWSGYATFQISIDASGEQLDWYFDEIDVFPA